MVRGLFPDRLEARKGLAGAAMGGRRAGRGSMGRRTPSALTQPQAKLMRTTPMIVA